MGSPHKPPKVTKTMEANARRFSASQYNKGAFRLHYRCAMVAAVYDAARDAGGPLVTVPTAARILGVTGQRVRALIKQGRIRLYELPTGNPLDRYVPIHDVLAAPSPLDSGRPAPPMWANLGRKRGAGELDTLRSAGTFPQHPVPVTKPDEKDTEHPNP